MPGSRWGIITHPGPTVNLLEPGVGTSTIDFSQTVTQILSRLGKDINTNPQEGFAVVSAYTDTWKKTMTARFNNQEERILGLESQLFISRTTIPKLRREMETSVRRANSVLIQVEDKMEEFQTWINHIRQSDLYEEIPMEMVNNLHEIIQDNSSSVSVENMRL